MGFAVNEHVEDGGGNDSMGSSAMCDVYIVLFTFLVHFWLFAK